MSKSSFNLSLFLSAIREDSLARVNRFEVMIPSPRGMSDLNRSYADFTSLYCEMASLPPVNISTKSFKIFGPTYQRPFGAEYGGEGISLTFHVDRDMYVRKFFEDWMNLIVDPNDFTTGYQADYITSIFIRQLDELENVTHEIELLEAFPRSMNLMELNNAATNQTHRLNILFSYRYWRNVDKDVTPVDVPRQIMYPEIIGADSRISDQQANAARRSFADTDPRRIDR
jgi:hypothetical protein